MKERPILFSAPMVRALLDGTKTQTRRAMKPQPWARPESEDGLWRLYAGDEGMKPFPCPYGEPGDRLWVKETFAHWHAPELFGGRMIPTVAFRAGSQVRRPPPGPSVPLDQWPLGWSDEVKPAALKWTPSIHMARRFSRMTLEITDVRVQRLQECSGPDAWAEGIPHSPDVNPVHEYEQLWDAINGAGAWDANPWVWALTFKRIAAG